MGFKVFFSDLANLDQFYRIVAFILLGVLILCGAFPVPQVPSDVCPRAGRAGPGSQAVTKQLAVILFAGLSVAAAAARERAALSVPERDRAGPRRPARKSSPFRSTATSMPEPAMAIPTFASSTIEARSCRTCSSRSARNGSTRSGRPAPASLYRCGWTRAKGSRSWSRSMKKPQAAGGLTIQTPLADYEHRVRVFGSVSGKDWAPLVTDGVIFDYSRFMDIRNRDVTLPANQFRQFKLIVEQELEDRESPLRELIRGQARRQEGYPHRDHPESTHPLSHRPRRALADGRERRPHAKPRPSLPGRRASGLITTRSQKLSRVEIESRREPLTRLSFATASKNFSRKARVLVPVERGVQTDWVEVGRTLW